MSTPAHAFQVLALEFQGLNRTNQAWLQDYLHIHPPQNLTVVDLKNMRQKLLTTAVFKDVKLSFAPDPPQSQQGRLVIAVTEKWTWIPVVRGALGGGTPLIVAGTYDTHTFGRLWTLGAEVRKYGDSPLSYLVWAKAPRWRQGEHFLNLTFWQNNRERQLYDERYNVVGDLTSKRKQVHFSFYFPVRWLGPGFQTGLDLNYFSLEPTAVNSTEPLRFLTLTEKHDEIRPLWNLIYDSVRITNLNRDGLRLLLKAGKTKHRDELHTHYELETFYYKLWSHDWNLASHLHIVNNTSNYIQSQTFLGGLNAIRGLDDGALYGPKAYYANIELRKVFMRTRYAWLQGNIFADAGQAGEHWSDIRKKQVASAGLGIKISIPQVNRLVLRMDYAWGLTKPSFQGLSLGFNGFFQPYSPF